MKRRPAVVLTRSAATPVLARLVVATITTRIRDIPTEVELTQADGMPKRSVVTLDNIETVELPYFLQRQTTLSDERMAEICNALLIATGC